MMTPGGSALNATQGDFSRSRTWKFTEFCSQRPLRWSPSVSSAPSVAPAQGLRSLWVSCTGQRRRKVITSAILSISLLRVIRCNCVERMHQI